MLLVTPECDHLTSVEKFFKARVGQSFYSRLSGTSGDPGTQFDIDEDSVLIKREFIDDYVQVADLGFLHTAVLYRANYPKSAAHPSCRSIGNIIRRTYNWHMASDINRSVEF